MTVLTLGAAVESLERILEGVPEDYVYEDATSPSSGSGAAMDCWYLRPDGTGSCLIGRMLLDLGYDKEVLARADEVLRLHGEAASAESVCYSLNIEFDDESTRTFIANVQCAQDVGDPWHRAVRVALYIAGWDE